jgi:hypothetical protein
MSGSFFKSVYNSVFVIYIYKAYSGVNRGNKAYSGVNRGNKAYFEVNREKIWSLFGESKLHLYIC